MASSPLSYVLEPAGIKYTVQLFNSSALQAYGSCILWCACVQATPNLGFYPLDYNATHTPTEAIYTWRRPTTSLQLKVPYQGLADSQHHAQHHISVQRWPRFARVLTMEAAAYVPVHSALRPDYQHPSRPVQLRVEQQRQQQRRQQRWRQQFARDEDRHTCRSRRSCRNRAAGSHRRRSGTVVAEASGETKAADAPKNAQSRHGR
eukprot:TRINITY_DN4979_c0_g1_i1.p1 TRINITY_DN4979_c0_g1~~TRINITY_DN4979_c0_g1_i1.p1  ORF type:complete len:205 (+),score=24.66 TRINITY_DN4979_c0_g1_i1:116-730(+)